MPGLYDFLFGRDALNKAAGQGTAGPAPAQGGPGAGLDIAAMAQAQANQHLNAGHADPYAAINAQPMQPIPGLGLMQQQNMAYQMQHQHPFLNGLLDKGQKAYGLLQQGAPPQQMPQAPPLQMAPSAGIGRTPQGAPYPLPQETIIRNDGGIYQQDTMPMGYPPKMRGLLR